MLNDGEVKNIWNENAEFWDGKMGEGNRFHKLLIEPAQRNLLNVKKDDKILDMACGNGQFARKLASLGADVLAVDFSEKFISLAESKGTQNIEYRLIDATDSTDLNTLPFNFFDAVVCTMALMDMENIEVLFSYLPKLLKRTGVFVFSVLHPCFNSGENVLVHERDDFDGAVNSKYSVKIRNYLTEKSYMGIGIVGQPKPQYYFHRPVSTILKILFKNGFILDAFEEPSLEKIENPDCIFDNVFSRIPPALVCRMRTVL